MEMLHEGLGDALHRGDEHRLVQPWTEQQLILQYVCFTLLFSHRSVGGITGLHLFKVWASEVTEPSPGRAAFRF